MDVQTAEGIPPTPTPRGSGGVAWMSALEQEYEGSWQASSVCFLLETLTGWGEGKCRQAAQHSGCRHFFSSIHSVFIPQVVSALDGQGEGSLKPSPCRLAADLPSRKDKGQG